MPIYDVENRFSYYKNYSDNILVGPPKPTMGSSIWNRAVSGSVVSGSEEYKAATTLTEYYFAKNNPFLRSGEVRYLRLVSAAQTLIDSIVPNIFSLYKTGSFGTGSFVYSTKDFAATDVYLKMYWSLDGYPVTASYSDPNIVNNINFCKASPFEKQYSEVPRFYTENLNLIADFKEFGTYFGSNTVPFKVTKNKLIICLTTGSAAGVGLINNIDAIGIGGASTFTVTDYTGSFANPVLAPKLVFGINPRPISTNNSGHTISGYVVSNMTGAYIEGWKYGLYNGIPTNFSCVFRQNHYGQPRDMLEGRIYTKTYNNPAIGGPLDEAGGINFISGSALRGESDNWLTASIYGSTNVAAAYTVNPYGSGIFDKEYRASQPWFDNDPRVGT
jgi:hypothetical protein